MNKMRKKTIINIVATCVMLVIFFVVSRNIDQEYIQRFTLISDGAQFSYGIDSLEREENLLRLKGWFVELKSVQNVLQNVSREDAELLLGLVPLDEAIVDVKVDGVPVMKVETMHEDRPDVNGYFSCEFDYSKCGFTATIECDDINLSTTSYRLAIKTDAKNNSKAVLTNVYITDEGISYTDPRYSPRLETEGTDLDKITNEGVRLVSRPDISMYIYQLGDKLYWIADDNYPYFEDGATYMQYQMETTQIERLPEKRLANKWFWSNIGDYFEKYEITGQINCGKYRVSKRDIPLDYSVTQFLIGYHDGEWVWEEIFKPCYNMLF